MEPFKQAPRLYDSTLSVVEALVRTYHQVEFMSIENAHGSFVLLPKHSSIIDIPLEAMYLKAARASRPYFLMKAALPRGFRELLELYGGIVVRRAKDLSQSISEHEKRRMIDLEKQRVDQIMTTLLDSGRIVVNHIEGTRRPDVPFEIHKSKIARLARLQTKNEPRFVAMNICYASRATPLSTVRVDTAPPITTRDPKTLESYLRDYFKC